MNIVLKLYASLAVYLPPAAEGHLVRLQVEPDETPHQILDRYAVPRERAYLLLLNGVYLTPPRRDEPLLKEGDVLAAWPPVAGG